MLSSFINAAVCSQPGFASSAAFVLAHRLADVNEEDEMTTMFGVFADVLSRVLPATLADLVAVRTRVRVAFLPRMRPLLMRHPRWSPSHHKPPPAAHTPPLVMT